MEGSFVGIFLLALAVLLFLILFFYFVPVNLWIKAVFSGVRISIAQLILMRIRKVPPAVVVNALINNVDNVVKALISSDKANIELSFQEATAIDLAGRQVYDAVQMSVNPKVINTPPVTGVAKDGIQLEAKARVTVRANIRQLVGGAGEETILARVGEGIVTSIGSADAHTSVLENPDSISRTVLKKGLDAGTAFEILSIDVADVDVGKNIGASLQIDQANADKNIAQAKAEERRAMAIAEEQEQRAKAQQARVKVIEAEAEVPLATGQALREGRIGVMDYYRMQNVQSDTSMRESISKTAEPEDEEGEDTSGEGSGGRESDNDNQESGNPNT